MIKRFLNISKKILLLICISFAIILFSEKDINAISCPTGYSCRTNSITFNPPEWGTTGSNSTCRLLSGYTCNGNNSDCREDYVNTWGGYGCTGTHKRIDNGCCSGNTPPTCTNCTPPACPTGSAESPSTGDAYKFTTSCSRGDGCSPATNTRICYWQRQNLCSSATSTPTYLKPGQSSTVTSIANTNVNTFFYAFYNIDNPNTANNIVCSATQIAGWATTQGSCPSGTYQLLRTNTYTAARTSETTTFPASNIFINDANYGGALVKNLQINGYYIIDGRPLSIPEIQCVFNQRLCDPLCTPALCAPAYETVNQGFGSTVFSCNNSPSQCGTESRTCFCRACTAPACEPQFSSVNYGYGSTILSCTNNCGVSSNRTCYIDRCNNCTLPGCPSPLTPIPTTTNPNMELSLFRQCSKNSPCGGPPRVGSCFEQVSPQPTTSLQIFSDDTNSYGFSSNSQTGIRMSDYNLNDPLHMTATYTDINGATDIEAVSVWFRDSTQAGEVTSPLWIDSTESPRAQSTDSWGFMMRYEGSSWVPYIPSYPTSGTPYWVRAVSSDGVFDIAGPGGVRMVRVTIGNRNLAGITRSGNNVVLPFQLSFTYTGGSESVAETNYNVYLMGNDVFSFTPNDNYTSSPEINSKIGTYWQPGQLRYRTLPTPAQTYARQWVLQGTWTIDKQSPESNPLSVTVIDDTLLELAWNTIDDKGIYAVVGNIYASMSMTNPSHINISNVTGGTLDVAGEYTLEQPPSTGIGHLNNNYAFRKLSVGSNTYSDRVRIDIGNNNEGSLIIYLTVFDMAGNITSPTLTYSLGDWIVTYGGFTYSSGGMDYEIKNIEGNPWSAVDVLANLNSSYADVTTELFGDRVNSVAPAALSKSSLVESYHLRPFVANTDISNWYIELIKAYRGRLIENKVDMLPISSITGDLTNSPGCNSLPSAVCVSQSGNLTVGSSTQPFTCNTKGVFFVNGDLTIENEILNSNINNDACIFVVNGNVQINEGPQRSSTTQIQYDRINAYIIANGTFTIAPELGDRKYDGIFIGGGFYSNSGLIMSRSLKLVDRNIYPALVTSYHSKYAILSNLVFGSQIDMVKTEIGYKPY